MKHRSRHPARSWLVLLCSLSAAAAAQAPPDLTQLSLEQLSGLEVTSVSRRQEPLSDAAAAITVVTNEEIRRMGATAVPESLRFVPGLHVGQVTSSSWSVNSRGFSSVNSAKLLVLSDTRSIYTPLFSGVFWDAQDFLLEDIDRIEVIRGPGASLWGTNAVNGVINITSKSAKQTQGAYFEGGGGNEERAFGAVRYGGNLGDGLYFRVFAKGFSRAEEFKSTGPANDNWKMGHAGFRADWDLGANDQITFQGDAYTADVGLTRPSIIVSGRPGPTGRLVTQTAGGNLLARWTHSFEAGSELQVRAYYDGTHRDDPSFLDNLDTFDVDVQHRFRLPFHQEVVWGAEVRGMDDRNQGKGVFALQPPNSWDNVVSGFVQDQIALDGALKVTLGTKLEDNDFSGFEVQPTARLAWNPLKGQTLWASASRATRVPTRLERDLDISITPPGANPAVLFLGNKDFRSEVLLAYEAGYRFQLERQLLVDLAAFYNIYHRLSSLERGQTFVDPATNRTIVPLRDQNLSDGVAEGAEAAVTWTPLRWWRLVGDYTYFFLRIDPKGQDLNRGVLFAGSTPRNQFGVQSFLDLPKSFQLDAFFRYASSIPAASQLFAGDVTPAYATVDLRLSWQGVKGLEFSLVGKNVVQDHHREFPGGTEIERSAYVKIAGRLE